MRGGPGLVLAVEPGRGRALGAATSPSEQHVAVSARAEVAEEGNGHRVASMTSPGQEDVERLRGSCKKRRKLLQER